MIIPSMMKFQLGRLVITPAVLSTASVDEICQAIDRHVCGQWDEVPGLVGICNESGLSHGGRLLSVHRLANGVELHVLTTADRLTTMVYLQGEGERP